MTLVPHSTKIRPDQKTKLQLLAEKMKCSRNEVIIKLIDRARV